MKAAVLAVACTLAASASANIVVNGDFSSGTLAGWTWTPDVAAEPTMTATVAAGPFGSGNAFRVNPGAAVNGNEKGGTLSQSLLLSGGVTYTLTGIVGIQNVGGSINADGGTITVSFGGSTVATLDVGQINPGALFTQPINANFTPGSSGSYALEVRTTRPFQNFVPNIYHWGDSFSVVPAPASGLAVLAGAILSVRRRRGQHA